MDAKMHLHNGVARLNAALDSGMAAHRACCLDEAEAAYRAVLLAAPEHPDALHLLGLLHCDRDGPAEALPLVEAAIAHAPDRAAFHATRGRALAALGRPAEAATAYRHAWALRPDTAEIANNFACLLRDQGDGAALGWFRAAWRLAPGSAAIAANLAAALDAAGASDESLAVYAAALALVPRNAGLQVRRAEVAIRAGQPRMAVSHLRVAIRLRPDDAGAHNALGVALERLDLADAAAQAFADAVRCDPDHVDALSNLGCMRLLDGRGAEAARLLDRAVALAPLHGKARWARCMAELPSVYDSAAEIDGCRARYADALGALADAAADPAVRHALGGAIGASQPFFLPAQGLGERGLMARYGALLDRLIDPDPRIRLARPVADGAPIPVAIVTGFACEHTIWRLMVKGWLTHLDRRRVTVMLVHTGAVHDAETAYARGHADHYVGGAGADPRAAILAFRPQVLIYPELGIDPTCARLAVERLAPVQCVAWGQPHTSGRPAIDWFLSGAAMEPPAASLHYTERLACLPRLGVHPMMQAVAPAPLTRASLGLRPDATAFWCGQPVWKYLPQHDAVFARIARAVPDSQFLFIAFARSHATTLRLQARIARCFAAAGLDARRHCVWTDSMDQARFLGSVAACDIVLDSIGWSGGKSTLDMLAVAPVIVTHAGGLMRGRHTAAILRCLGIHETVADSVDGYVDLAVGLAADPAARAGLRARMAGGRSWLLDDLSPIRALEDFLDDATRSARAGRKTG